MERLLKPYNKETMKMTMLKHEETFKEQVYELHRLYRIQKMLMHKMKSSEPSRCGPNRWNLENENSLSGVNFTCKEQQKPQRKLDLERPAEEYITDEGRDEVLEIEDGSDIELTLGPTSFQQRKKDDMPLTSDAGPSFSSSSTESCYIQRTSTNTRKWTYTREELRGPEWELIQMHNSFQSGNNAFDVDGQMQQERLKQPPWLFQVLSLNMT